MSNYILKRLLQGVAVIFAAMCIAFILMYVIGDPVLMRVGPEASTARVEEMRKQWGFDRPMYIQFIDFAGDVMRGDLGVSYRQRVPVLPLLLFRLRRSAEVALPAFALSIIVSLPVGMLSATRRNSIADYITRTTTLAGQAAPNFWVAIMMIVLFAIVLGWLPVSGRTVDEGFIVYLKHLVMPMFTLSLWPMAYLTRMMRSSTLEVLSEDYVRTARSKGLAEKTVIFKHVARNSLLPYITLAAMQIGHLIAGSMVIESVYAWPGMGRLFMSSILNLDIPVVAGALMLVAAIKIIMNLLADILYVYIDPRVKY